MLAVDRARERLGEYYKKNKEQLTLAGAAALIVFVAYTIFNVILWNTVSISYSLIYGAVAVVIYFIAMRLMRFIKARKEASGE